MRKMDTAVNMLRKLTPRNVSILILPVIGLWFSFSGYIFAADSVPEKVYKVGVSEWTGYPDSVRGFKDSMTKGGLIEGRNVVYLYKPGGMDQSNGQEIAAFFRDAGVDLVYSLTTPGTLIMKRFIPETTPIVFSIVTYPEDSGLIESIEYSGNNLVGTSNYVELDRYFMLLRAVLPNARSIAIFRKNREPNSKIQAVNMIRLAKRQGIRMIDTPVETSQEAREAALRLAGEVDVFMATTDTLMQSGGERALIEVSLDKKVPILSSNKNGIEQGSTFGVVADLYVLGQMSGEMAVRILKEKVKPESLQSRIQTPPLTLINRKSSGLLGISIPEKGLENVKYVE